MVLAQQIRRNLYEQIQNEKLFAIHMCDIQERSIQSKIKHCKLLLSHVTEKKEIKKGTTTQLPRKNIELSLGAANEMHEEERKTQPQKKK